MLCINILPCILKSGKITEIFCRKMSTICTASLTDKKLKKIFNIFMIK